MPHGDLETSIKIWFVHISNNGCSNVHSTLKAGTPVMRSLMTHCSVLCFGYHAKPFNARRQLWHWRTGAFSCPTHDRTSSKIFCQWCRQTSTHGSARSTDALPPTPESFRQHIKRVPSGFCWCQVMAWVCTPDIPSSSGCMTAPRSL